MERLNLSVTPDQVALISLGFQALIAQVNQAATELNAQLQAQQKPPVESK